jgi:hypothetical protein
MESHGRERLMMDGKASKAVRSEIHSQEACRVNSAVLGLGEGRTRKPRDQPQAGVSC